ncbi:MAG: ATP-binding protein, partial [Rhodospirillaceae bacterium]
RSLSVYFRDVTAQRRALAQLQQAQKIDAVGQLTGGIAHDFNTLLTVITGNADVLLDGVQTGDPRRETIELIRMAAKRGAELTHRLLAFARRQPLEPEMVDVNEMLDDVEPLLRRTLGEAIDMKFVRRASLWNAQVDPAQLESALMNLAINARDAMPNGGKLTFETRNIVVDQVVFAPREGEMLPGDYVMIAVADTGSGMTQEVLKKAFDPFFTTKEVGKGTGLGLSMVYGFAKQSGGHVKIYSELGQGTVVKIYLPRAMHGAAAAARPEGGPQVIPVGQERVLVVEDDELVRRFTRSVLQELGYTIAVASNAAEAVEIVDHGFQPDLLFTDVILPGGTSGRQLADALRAGGKVQRVLYTSGYTEDAIIHHGRLEPGTALLNKPFGKRELALKLRSVLERPAAA